METAERFWKKVDRRGPDECWPWIAGLHRSGYGWFRDERGRAIYAQRWAFASEFGPIPQGGHILHRCDNPPCVNPAHLYLGTHADNMRDLAERGNISMKGEHNPRARLTEVDIAEARRLYAEGGTSYASLARRFGVAKATIGHALSGRTWQ